MIDKFVEIRTDGRAIEEGMSIDQMNALGWPACRIGSIEWLAQGRPVRIDHPAGILAQVVAGRHFVVALLSTDMESADNQMRVLNDDGSVRQVFANVQHVGGRDEAGSFGWFERVLDPSTDTFWVTFEVTRNNAEFLLAIDARSGRVVQSIQRH